MDGLSIGYFASGKQKPGRNQCQEGLFWLTVQDHSVMVGKVWQLEQEAGYLLSPLHLGREGARREMEE